MFQSNEPFGVEVLKLIAVEHQYTSFASTLSEHEIADICIWLAKLGLDRAKENPGEHGLVTPPIALANWWNTLVNTLTYKGTFAACDAVRRLVGALPQYEGLKSCLREAEDYTRRLTWAPLEPSEIRCLASGSTTPELVISIHGIRTRGAWQKQINSELQKQGFRHELLDFFNALQLLFSGSRKRKIDWFRSEYERVVTEPRILPFIIAHSFGTYIVAKALEKYPEIRFNRVIFSGSIVRRDFDWASLIRTGRVGAILNEIGGKDIWSKLAEWVIGDAGASGAIGFSSSGLGIYQRRRPRFRHSDHFYALNYTRNWIPYLLGDAPAEVAVEKRRRINWRFWLFVACGLVSLGAAALFLTLGTR